VLVRIERAIFIDCIIAGRVHPFNILKPLFERALDRFNVLVQAFLSQIFVDDLSASDLVICGLNRAVFTLAIAITIDELVITVLTVPVNVMRSECDISSFKNEL
jgi:hypothetical protein